MDEQDGELIISYAYAEGNGAQLLFVVTDLSEKIIKDNPDVIVKTSILNDRRY